MLGSTLGSSGSAAVTFNYHTVISHPPETFHLSECAGVQWYYVTAHVERSGQLMEVDSLPYVHPGV